jgi:2-oxoglutarate ferredoxin oxidoreductase subunit beta
LAEVAGANYVARETPYHGWELKELIKEALNKKGFSLVEVFSPCPTHFGKNNEMKETREMLDWFKKRGLPAERYRKLSAEEQKDHFAIGKLVDRDAPDFNTRYEEIRVRAMAQKAE